MEYDRIDGDGGGRNFCNGCCTEGFLGRDTASDPEQRTSETRSGTRRLGTATLRADGGGILGAMASRNGGAACGLRRDFWSGTLRLTQNEERARLGAPWRGRRRYMRTHQKKGKLWDG